MVINPKYEFELAFSDGKNFILKIQFSEESVENKK